MKITVIIAIFIIHWLADFVCQSDKQAKGKSTSILDLLSHTITYSFIWLLLGTIYMSFQPDQYINVVFFVGITFGFHTLTDFFTSKLNSKLWKDSVRYSKSPHNFFVGIGFDQMLHYIQLLLTYYYLIDGPK